MLLWLTLRISVKLTVPAITWFQWPAYLWVHSPMGDYSRCDGQLASQKSLCGVRARGEQALRDITPIRIASRLPQRDQRLQQLGDAIGWRGRDLGLLGHACGPLLRQGSRLIWCLV